MLQALLVTFREGIESFLIVGVVIAYLKKSRRPGLVRGVKIGLGISLVTCTAGAWLWLQVPNQPLYEGIAALSAAVVVGALLVQMVRSGPPHARRDRGARRPRWRGTATGAAPSARALAGVALVTALLVTREGLEAVFYLGVQALALRAAEVRAQAILVVAGAVLGLAGAAARRLELDALRPHAEPGRHPQGDRALPRPVPAAARDLRRPRAGRERRHPGDAGVPRRHREVRPRRARRPLLSYSLLGAPLLYLFWARRAAAARRRRPQAAG